MENRAVWIMSPAVCSIIVGRSHLSHEAELAFWRVVYRASDTGALARYVRLACYARDGLDFTFGRTLGNDAAVLNLSPFYVRLRYRRDKLYRLVERREPTRRGGHSDDSTRAHWVLASRGWIVYVGGRSAPEMIAVASNFSAERMAGPEWPSWFGSGGKASHRSPPC